MRVKFIGATYQSDPGESIALKASAGIGFKPVDAELREADGAIVNYHDKGRQDVLHRHATLTELELNEHIDDSRDGSG